MASEKSSPACDGLIVTETAASWLVLVAGFLGQALSMGFYYAFGTIYVALLEEYDLSETVAAWIGSVGYSVCFLFGFLMSFMCERCGCRFVMMLGGGLIGLGFTCSSFTYNAYALFLTYGLMASAGMGAVFFSSLLCLPLYFHRHLVLANGIASSGSGIGGLLLSPYIEYLIRTQGIRKTFQIYSALGILPIIASLMIRRRSARKAASIMDTVFDRTLLKNKAFLLYTFAMCVILFGYYIPYVHLVNFVELKGISSERAAILMGVMTVTASIGKVIYGKISEIRWFNRLYLAQFALLILSVSLTLCSVSSTYFHFILFAVFYGFFDGGYCSYIFVMCSEVVNRGQIGVGFGMMYTFSSLFSLAGPPFAGTIYTVTKSYEFAFILCGAVFMLGAISLFFVPLLLPKEVQLEKNLLFNNVQQSPSMNSINMDKKSLLAFSTDSGIDSGLSWKDSEDSSEKANVLTKLMKSYLDFSRTSLVRTASYTVVPYAGMESIEGVMTSRLDVSNV